MKTSRIAGILSVGLLLVVPAVAQKKPGGGGVRCPSTMTAVFNETANSHHLYIGSDGSGAYPASLSTSAGETASSIVIDAGLYGGGGKNRRGLNIRFVEEYLWEGSNRRPFDIQTTPAYAALNCYSRGIAVDKLLPADGPRTCALVTHFAFGRVSYRIGTNSDSPHNPPFQGEDAQVACITADSCGCRHWQITPSGAPTLLNGDPNAKSRSMLFLQDTNELLGYWNMSFLINVTR